MIKAYLKNSAIVLVRNGKKKAEFTAGSALTAIGEKHAEKNPYTLFEDFDEAAFRELAHAELNKLYKLGNGTIGSLIGALDSGRADKLYTNKDFKVTSELVSGEAVFAVYLESARDLLALEMVYAMNRGKPLKRCENCGCFFFPSGRSDAVYCSRVGTDGFSCKQIGAHRQYRKNSRSDNIKKLYDKITKHNRYLKNKKLVSEENFSRWMAEASSMLAQYKRGEISEALLVGWLSDDINIKNRSVKRNEISDYLL